MLPEEELYYNQLKELDLKKEMLNALEMDHISEEIIISLKEDIIDCKKNVALSFSLIEDIIENIKDLIKLQEDEEDETEKDKYNEVISHFIKSAEETFKSAEDMANQARALEKALKFIMTPI